MANEVNIGNLDTLVMLRSVTKGRSADGSKTTVFEDFRQVYAQVERRVDEQVNTGNLEQGDFVQLTIYKVRGTSYSSPSTRCRSSLPAGR